MSQNNDPSDIGAKPGEQQGDALPMIQNSEEALAGPDYRDKNGDYLPISIEGLKAGTAGDLDLFARLGDGYFVVKPRNIEVGAKLIHRFRSEGTPYVYIRKSDREIFFKKIESQLSNIIASPSISVREKAGVLTDYAVEIIDQLYSDPGSPGNIIAAKSLTQECVRFVGSSRHAFLHLVELSNHDQYTYAHSVGVAAYTMALVPQVMDVDPETLADMGLASLLHDIGKCMVDPAIINKRGPLNEEEWAIMKKHPEYGGEIIRRHKKLSSLIALTAEGHHENLLGTGYPKGLVASKIDPLVRIVCLADAFSALTTKRSYSQPRDNLTALKLIRENLDKKFDANLFKPFVRLFLDPSKQVA